MYEKYFREFVACLFPNNLLDISILDFVEGEQSLEDAEVYKKKHGVDLLHNWEIGWICRNLSDMLEEMKKEKDEKPKKDLINFYLGNIIEILKKYNAPNIDKFESFQTFLRIKKGEDIT